LPSYQHCIKFQPPFKAAPDDRIFIKDHAELTPSGDMTCSTWIKFNSHNGSLLVQKNDSTDPWFSYQISMDASGIPNFEWINASRDSHNADLNTSVSTGAWHHIVGAHDGTTLRIYVDGSDANTTTDTTTGSGEDVDVFWETGSETDNIGFHLYRSGSANGEYLPLTEKVIPAAAYMNESPQYHFVDAEVTCAELYYYKLEGIDVHGRRTLHGPICVDWDADGIIDGEEAWRLTVRRY
jgi:hypothetical protein